MPRQATQLRKGGEGDRGSRYHARSCSKSGESRDVSQPVPALLFLTTIEVAEMLRISRRTLERMRVEGTGPRFLKVGPGKRSRVIYRQQDVSEWIDRFRFGSTSEYGRR
jgi:predicted DNA-binding transcriptional regulator AlpA